MDGLERKAVDQTRVPASGRCHAGLRRNGIDRGRHGRLCSSAEAGRLLRGRGRRYGGTAPPAAHEEFGGRRICPETQIDSADAVHLAVVSQNAQKGDHARLLAAASVRNHPAADIGQRRKHVVAKSERVGDGLHDFGFRRARSWLTLARVGTPGARAGRTARQPREPTTAAPRMSGVGLKK